MPQETNLNVSPYFDDFDKNKNFSRVLFKPGSPVQARELTTLQSILQNQIEQFGTHFFKEGSKVIPGNLTLDINFTCIQVEERFLGIPVSLYTDQLVGLRVTGVRSGVSASIQKILSKYHYQILLATTNIISVEIRTLSHRTINDITLG